MKRLIVAAVAAVLATCFAAPAPARADESIRDRLRKERKPLKKFDFTGDDIEADTVRPDGDDVNVVPFASHASLIRIRASFAKEIIRETEDL